MWLGRLNKVRSLSRRNKRLNGNDFRRTLTTSNARVGDCWNLSTVSTMDGSSMVGTKLVSRDPSEEGTKLSTSATVDGANEAKASGDGDGAEVSGRKESGMEDSMVLTSEEGTKLSTSATVDGANEAKASGDGDGAEVSGMKESGMEDSVALGTNDAELGVNESNELSAADGARDCPEQKGTTKVVKAATRLRERQVFMMQTVQWIKGRGAECQWPNLCAPVGGDSSQVGVTTRS